MPNLLSILLASVARRKARRAREEAANRPAPAPPPAAPRAELSDEDALFLDELFGEEVRRSLPAEVPPSDELYRFLHEQEWLATPQSSNVRAIQYIPGSEELVIEYGKPGQESTFWGYTVSPTLAQAIHAAASKGIWVWDHLRVRGKGNRHRHQVPAHFIGGKAPRWMRTAASAEQHARKYPDPRRRGRVR